MENMEKWTRWEPISNLSGKYLLSAFTWPEEGLIIELSNTNTGKKVQIIFDGHIDAFRYTNDSFCFKIIGDLSQQYDENFYKDYSFFKIENSEYLAWLSKKSCTLSDNFPFIHFCIIGEDEIIDVLARYEPKVKIIPIT